MNTMSRHRTRAARPTAATDPANPIRRPAPHPAGTGRSSRPRHAIQTILALLLLASGAGYAEPEQAQVAAELNRADTVENGCRLSFVIHNGTEYDFSSLQWDLVTFDPEGLIAARMAAELAPLRAKKTSVKQFDIQDFDCDRIARLLLNDISQCKAKGPNGEVTVRNDCLGLIELSSRTAIDLFK